MKKFVCLVCGYVYEGESAPDECPICHAPASKFAEQAAEKTHLHCRSCGKIFDAPVHGDPLADIARANGFEPETSVYIEYGVCEKCKKTN